MDGYQHVERWLRLAGRLEGLINAHQILKEGKGDKFDEYLWRVASDVIREAEDAGL